MQQQPFGLLIWKVKGTVDIQASYQTATVHMQLMCSVVGTKHENSEILENY